MYKAQNKQNKRLRMLLIGTGVAFLLFLITFFVYAALAANTGDADLKNFGAVIGYHFKGLGLLFIFQYGSEHNIALLALSYVLYALIAIFVIFLVLGIRIMKASGRRIQVFGFVAIFLNLIKYMLFASGAEKFWDIINRNHAFAHHGELLVPTILLIVFALAVLIGAVACYFMTLIEAYKNPKNEAFKEEEAYHNVAKEEVEEIVTNVIRRELRGLRPVEEKPQEELKEEPVPEQEQPAEEPAPQEEEAPVEEAPIEEPAEAEEEPVEEPAPEVQEEQPEEEAVSEEEQIAEAEELDDEEDNAEDFDADDDMDADEDDDESGDIFDGKRKPRMPYNMRLLTSGAELKANYNEIKNEIMAYGVKYRMSKKGELFCLHRKRYVKIYLVGKMLKVYFALNPEDYKDSPIPLEDVGYRAAYSETPLLLKVRSPLSVRRCKLLIADTMKADKREKGEVHDTNWIAKLREANSNRNKNKEKKKQ